MQTIVERLSSASISSGIKLDEDEWGRAVEDCRSVLATTRNRLVSWQDYPLARLGLEITDFVLKVFNENPVDVTHLSINFILHKTRRTPLLRENVLEAHLNELFASAAKANHPTPVITVMVESVASNEGISDDPDIIYFSLV